MELYTPTEPRFDPNIIKNRVETAKNKVAMLEKEFGHKIKLLAVTKTVPVEVINYCIDSLGIDAIGENRVQELLEKFDKLSSPAEKKLEIHLIGSLQTNKVKYIVDKVDMIESLDSLKLAFEIDRQCKKIGRKMDVLLEVNSGREEQKGGIFPEELEDFVERIKDFDSLNLRGLMTIAPKCENHAEYSKYFSETYHCFEKIKQKAMYNIDGSEFDTLSMGMSDSYPEAAACGSNEIRLGSTLFGKRINM